MWHVDLDNESGPEDGLTWPTAFATIQPAIDAAHDAGGGEVWVAEGTYSNERTSVVEFEGLGLVSPSVDTGSLRTRDGVDMYGGFAGTEMTRNDRDL